LRWKDNPERLKQLRDYRNEGLSFAQIAERMGSTRGAVAHAVWVYILGNKNVSGIHYYVRKKDGIQQPLRNWSEEALTETWAERKARRARETSHV